jgi:hypothetical protein
VSAVEATSRDADASGRGEGAARGDPRPGGRLPLLGVLRWVAGVGQIQRRPGLEVIVLSLEAYDDGFVVNVRIWYERPRVRGVPELWLVATDEAGRRYQAGRPRRVRDGGRTDHRWRAAYTFAPALVETAEQLSLEAADLYWMQYDARRRRMAVAELHPGPWAFSVALAALRKAPP